MSRLDRTRSRGQVKALGAEADQDPLLYAALVALAREQGGDPGPDLTGKALVRRVLQRVEAAQLRRNPIRRDEAFTCVHCGAAVDRGGARVRDHCPACLRSLHVDRVPGDRAADCGGLLHPTRLELLSGQVVIHYRCVKCGHEHRVRAHDDDQVPPDLAVASLPGPDSARHAGLARTLPRRLIEAIRAGGLWSPEDRVLVAVSGGVDSTVLLELLWRTQAAHGADLVVMSLDHGLRTESCEEVQQVMRHAQRLGLPAYTARLDLATGPSKQDRARRARRAALLAQAREVGAVRIATAHHQDDQAETVLQRLLAGAGSRGLAGMRALAPPWCRPLLGESRETLLAWARTEGLAWVEDPSNPTSQRGQIRTLLGSLGALREGATRGLARSASLLAEEDDFLELELDRVWPTLADDVGLLVSELADLHPALGARALRRLCGQAGVVPRADLLGRLLRALPAEGRVFELGGGHRLLVQGGRVRFVRR